MTSSTQPSEAMRLPDRPCDHCGDRSGTSDFYSAAVGEFRACGQPCANAYVRDRTGRARRRPSNMRAIDRAAFDYGLAVSALTRALHESDDGRRRAARAAEVEKAALLALPDGWHDDDEAWAAYKSGKESVGEAR